jgi:3-hydroxy acid dehydrogenase/malonic semialdehyde reductase
MTLFPRLGGKTVLITGASSGIGRSTALEFARASPNSLRLILTARRLEKLRLVATEVTKEAGSGVEIFVYQLDVTKPDEIDTFVTSLPKEFSSVDVLVNNA